MVCVQQKRKEKKKNSKYLVLLVSARMNGGGVPFLQYKFVTCQKNKRKKEFNFFFFYCRIVVVRGGFDLAGVLEIHKKKKIKLKPKTCKIWFLEEEKKVYGNSRC